MYTENRRIWVKLFIIPTIHVDKFFYNNAILLVSLKMIRSYIILLV